MTDRKWLDRRQAIGLMGMAGLLTACSKAPVRISGDPGQSPEGADIQKKVDPAQPGPANPLEPMTSPKPSPAVQPLPQNPGPEVAAGPMPQPPAQPLPQPQPMPQPVPQPPAMEVTPAPQPKRSCVLSPAQIEGPYFVDEKLNRSDIRPDPSNGSLQAGVPLQLQFYVSRITAMTCEPLTSATFDIWHANPLGIYSDVTNAKGKKYLRGYQITDSMGQVAFKTVYPGWYPGRAVHIHIKVRLYDSSKKLTFEFTTQIYFDDQISKAVFASHPAYGSRGAPDTSNKSDGFFNNDTQLLVKLEKDGEGYKGVLDVGVKI